MRFPTLCDDVARCFQLIVHAKRADLSRLGGTVLHCSSPEASTKYQQALLMAQILGVGAAHLKPSSDPPSGAPCGDGSLTCAPCTGRAVVRLETSIQAAPCCPLLRRHAYEST